MICPNCRAEFRAGIDRCADCDVPLVAAPAVDQGADPVRLVKAADPVRLSVLKTLLEAEGIPYFVQGEASLHMLPIAGQGGIFSKDGLAASVMVSENYIEQARAVIEASDVSFDDEDLEED